MGITEILRRIWLFSANKIKSSESISKQQTQLTHRWTQLIIAAHNCHRYQIPILNRTYVHTLKQWIWLKSPTEKRHALCAIEVKDDVYQLMKQIYKRNKNEHKRQTNITKHNQTQNTYLEKIRR